MFSAVIARLRAIPWPFYVVIALAAGTRLAALPLIDYRYDEASGVHFAFVIADGQWLTLAPQSGSIATHPPLALYVMALPALLARDVLWVAGFRAALDVVAVGALAWIGSQSFGRVAGFVGSLAYAVGPWAIYFARKTWVSPIGLFGTIALLGALLLVGQRRAGGWPIATLGVALAISSHLSGLYLLPGLALALLLGWRRLQPAVLLAGLIPLALVAAAYAAADAPTAFQNIQSLLRAQGGGGAGTAALDFALWQTSGAKLAEYSGLPALFVREGTPPDLINFVPPALVVLGMVLAVGQWQRDRTRAQARAALVAVGFWLGVIVPQLRASPAPQPHYVQLAIPAAFALVGYAASAIWRWVAARPAIWPRLGLAGLLLGVTGYDLAYTFSLNSAAAATGPFPGYRPMAPALAVATAARGLLASCSAGEILIGAPGANPEVDDQAAVYGTLLADRRPRLFDTRMAVLAPAGCGVWIIAPGDGRAPEALGVAGYGARRAVPFPAPEASLGRWAHGIEALGVGVGVAESTWATVTLRVTKGGIGGEDAHWFARLESGGREVASRDIAGVRPSDWRVGDTIGLYFDFAPLRLERGTPVILRIGSYRYPELSGIGVQLPDGKWADALVIDGIAP